MPKTLFTTSWDDGHPLDLRLAELLSKRGFQGTFYVPGTVAAQHCTPDGMPVMPDADLRRLGSAFEVGSHTLEHRFLDELPDAEARHQIVAGKAQLEDRLGRGVEGFCYPGGRFSDVHCRLVREAGFTYARTAVNLDKSPPEDPMQLSTTVQFYPHTAATYVKNFVRWKRWRRRAVICALAVRHADLKSRLQRLLDLICDGGGVFHLWGHAWEIDRLGAWSQLDDFLRYAGDRVPSESRLSNGALARIFHERSASPVR